MKLKIIIIGVFLLSAMQVYSLDSLKVSYYINEELIDIVDEFEFQVLCVDSVNSKVNIIIRNDYIIFDTNDFLSSNLLVCFKNKSHKYLFTIGKSFFIHSIEWKMKTNCRRIAGINFCRKIGELTIFPINKGDNGGVIITGSCFTKRKDIKNLQALFDSRLSE